MSAWDLNAWDQIGDEFCACLNAYASAAGIDLREADERDSPRPPPAAPEEIKQRAHALAKATEAMVEFCLAPLTADVALLRRCAELSGHSWFRELADQLEKGAFPS